MKKQIRTAAKQVIVFAALSAPGICGGRRAPGGKAEWALSQSRLLLVFFRGLVLAPAGLNSLLSPGFFFFFADRTPPFFSHLATRRPIALRQFL
jgi:hypothetical protein